MSIRIFTEQSVIFTHPEDRYTKFEARCYEFTTAPDWITKSIMFSLLQKDDKIKVIESAAEAKVVEKTGKIDKAPKVEETVEVESEVNDNELVALADMTKKELYDLCKEKGIECEPKKTKDYYLNLLSE